MNAKQKAIEHIIFNRFKDEVVYPLDDCTSGVYKKIVEAIDIALEERTKEIELKARDRGHHCFADFIKERWLGEKE